MRGLRSLEVEGIEKSFDEVRAVQGSSFTAERGEDIGSRVVLALFVYLLNALCRQSLRGGDADVR